MTKQLLQMKKYFYLLCILFLPTLMVSQNNSVTIKVTKPKVKALENKENLRNNIYYTINETLIGFSDFITVVEREHLGFLNKRREKLKKDDNPNVGAAAMVGANYILESKTSDVEFSSKKATVKKMVKGKYLPRYMFSEHVKYTIDFELVNVETGEIDFQYRMDINGLGYELKNDSTYTFKEKLVSKAMDDAKDCFQSVLGYMVASITETKCPIVQVYDIKKDKAKSLYIAGGPKTPYGKSRKFDIVKEYTQTVGGEQIKREEKIGEAKYNKSYSHLSKCSISKGKKEVLAAYQEGAKLFCVPTEMKHVPTCGARIQSSKRASIRKGYNAARVSDPDPNAKKINLNKKKKPKNTKKVTRKSSN